MNSKNAKRNCSSRVLERSGIALTAISTAQSFVVSHSAGTMLLIVKENQNYLIRYTSHLASRRHLNVILHCWKRWDCAVMNHFLF